MEEKQSASFMEIVAEFIVDKRKAFFEAIAKKGQNAKFLNGWLNRVKDFYV